MKKENQMILKKPVQALVMIPKIGKLTVTARKLLNVMLHSTQGQIAEFTLQGKDVPAGHLFTARLCDLLDPIECGASNLRSAAKGYFLEMRDIRLEWEAPDIKAKAGIVWANYDLLSEARFEYSGNEVKEGGHQNNALIAKWAFPPSIFNTLRFPELYAQICIYQIAKLSSYESLSLYEICSRYRTNPEGVTSQREPEWWVRALSNKAPTVDSKTNLPKLRPWPKFKNDKIQAAINQINEKTDLEIALIEKKKGKTITSIQFSVKRKPTALIEDISTPKMSPEIAEKSTVLGLALVDISNLIKNGQSENVLKVALGKLADRCDRKDLVPVESKLAYLNSVLTDTNKYVKKTTVLPSKSAVLTPTPIVLNFKDQRRAKIKIEMLELPKERQHQLAIAGLESLKAAGFLSPSIKRAFDSNDWVKNGLLLSKMIEVYAVEQYGASWGVETEREAENSAWFKIG